MTQKKLLVQTRAFLICLLIYVFILQMVRNLLRSVFNIFTIETKINISLEFGHSIESFS